jgi:hypothetical protein
MGLAHKMLLRLLFLLAAFNLFVVLPSFGSATSQDTAHLVEVLANQRGKESVTPEAYKVLQAEYLRWLDARVKNGNTPKEMNGELSSAGLIDLGWEIAVAESQAAHTGYLGNIQIAPVRETGFSALQIGIFTGDGCSLDETLAIYNSRSSQRVITINSDNAFSGTSMHLSGFALGKADLRGRRVIATSWFHSRCTSIWSSAVLRIDTLDGNSIKPILRREVGAKEGDREDKIQPLINGNIVEFRYSADIWDMEAVALPIVARYRLVGQRPVRETPIALTRGSFLREWLNLDDDEAVRWSSSGASALHHSVAAQFARKNFEWRSVSHCQNGSYELHIQVYESDSQFTFHIGGSNASTMRVEAISRMPSPSCEQLDISTDRSSIYAKIPR